MMAQRRAFALLLLSHAAAPVVGLNNGFTTPDMGFNTWEKWGCDISEDKVHAAADAMVSKGLFAAGCASAPRNRHYRRWLTSHNLVPGVGPERLCVLPHTYRSIHKPHRLLDGCRAQPEACRPQHYP